MTPEEILQCPLCKQSSFTQFLVCEDFTTTNEKFTLQQCSHCSFIITNPRPSAEDLPKYYESDKYISHTGGSSGIIDSLYLLARKYTLQRKTKLIEQNVKRGRLLDYGCGTGEFLKASAIKGWTCTGVEPSDIVHNNASFPEHIKVYRSLAQVTENRFDVITLWHVLEHVIDFQEKLAELKNVLADNGTLFVAVPNHTSYDAKHYREHWAAYDVPRHLWHFSKSTMSAALQSQGLTIRAILPMKLDAYYVSILSEKYKRGNQTLAGVLNALTIASLSNLRAGSDNYSSLIYVVEK